MQNNSEHVTRKEPTGPRSEVEIPAELVVEFHTACERRRLDSIQEALSRLSKREAVALLIREFPHMSKSWFERNLKYLMAMELAEFYQVFGHKDPTARNAIRNLPNKVSPTRLAFSM